MNLLIERDTNQLLLPGIIKENIKCRRCQGQKGWEDYFLGPHIICPKCNGDGLEYKQEVV